MPNYHDIACHTCREFMGTFKWTAPFRHDATVARNGTFLSREEIMESIERTQQAFAGVASDHWFDILLPHLQSFLESHRNHELRFYLEGTGPWQPEESDYVEWKEIIGVDFASSSEFYLPRNLIDDLKLTSWDQALELLQENEVFLLQELDLEKSREKFAALSSHARRPERS